LCFLAKSTQIGKPDISNRYQPKAKPRLSLWEVGFLITP